MLKSLYTWFALAIVSGYAYAALTGWEIGAADSEPIPPSVRQSPGGYRSFAFWHSGPSGGK